MTHQQREVERGLANRQHTKNDTSAKRGGKEIG